MCKKFTKKNNLEYGESSYTIEEFLDLEESCNYCRHEDGCPRSVRCYGGPTIEPSCYSDGFQNELYDIYLDDRGLTEDVVKYAKSVKIVEG